MVLDVAVCDADVGTRVHSIQDADFEAKVNKLVELGFDTASATQALRLFNGNEDKAAAFLFGG